MSAQGNFNNSELPACLHDSRPLRVLYLDFNSFFASVEQQENPNFRGQPIAVVPVLSDSSCVIAASYEAKQHGIGTGTQISKAKQLCPNLQILLGRHSLYVDYHKRVLKVVEQLIPIEKVRSIDEFQIRLLGIEKDRNRAISLAQKIKLFIQEEIGTEIRCSIGIAPNAFLAKMGTELEKPNGLVVLEKENIYQLLSKLKLTDFTGINRAMQSRLSSHGIFSAKDLLNASKKELIKAFASVVGERWWYELRGYEITSPPTTRRSLGHSHVLPPELRNQQGAKAVLIRLLHKAVARLHVEGLWASEILIYVKSKQFPSHASSKLPHTQDIVYLTNTFLELWKQIDASDPKLVGITFSGLLRKENVTPSLFESIPEQNKLNQAIRYINQKYGKDAIHLAETKHSKDTADEKIAFQKTTLFDEGKKR